MAGTVSDCDAGRLACNGNISDGFHKEIADDGSDDLRLMRWVVSQFRPYRRTVALVGVLILLTAGFGVANPLLVKVVFDRALFIPGGPNLDLLGLLAGGMITISLLAGAFTVWRIYLTNSVGQRVMADLRARLYVRLQSFSLRFFTSTRTGEIQSRLVNDVGGLQTVITDTASMMLTNMVILISSLAAMAILTWKLTLLSLVLLPLFGCYAVMSGRVRRRATAQAQAAQADMCAMVQESLSVSGVLLTKVFGRQVAEVAHYARHNERLSALQVRQQMIRQGFSTVVTTIFSLTPALIYLAAGFAEDISPGTLVAFTSLQFQLFSPLAQLLSAATDVISSLALFERVHEYLSLKPDIVDSSTAMPLPAPVRGAVRLTDVWFSYDGSAMAAETTLSKGMVDGLPEIAEQRWALRGVSLDVAPGMLVALVGPSGAGKTTLAYLIPRLYDVTHGSVQIDGIDVRDATQASLAGTIGMVTQDTYLFHASIRANLGYARPDASDADIEAAARAAQIHDRIMELGSGYDTVVGERGYRLSGGERQRIAIARVILKNPRVLILDEATSALDSVNERLVQAALAPVMAGRTTIAIAHRLSTIRAADVICALEAGRIVECGSHEELLARGGTYTRLYQEQFGAGAVEGRCHGGIVLANGSAIT